MFEYKLKKKSSFSKARIGEFKTPHGVIETPIFMPVGTVGAVKTMSSNDLDEVGSQIILSNTYHLYLRPGNKLIKKAGGLHVFMGYKKPILTDSGGFQVFSLGEATVKAKGGDIKPAKIRYDGVEFHSHLDGSKHFFRPKDAVSIQEDLGSDIIMAFDDCAPANSPRKKVEQSLERTHRWLEECIACKTRGDQALFPICQGGVHKDLREESAKFINSKNLPGNAIGGVSVGEEKEKIYEVASWCVPHLDEKKPRYLMGIGYPEDIVRVIALGIDMFDCVLPSRLARHGILWRFSDAEESIKLENLDFSYQQINIRNTKYKEDFQPISKGCRCKACRNNLSLAYLRHLVLQNEPLGIHLLTHHNLVFVFDLIQEIKARILVDKF